MASTTAAVMTITRRTRLLLAPSLPPQVLMAGWGTGAGCGSRTSWSRRGLQQQVQSAALLRVGRKRRTDRSARTSTATSGSSFFFTPSPSSSSRSFSSSISSASSVSLCRGPNPTGIGTSSVWTAFANGAMTTAVRVQQHQQQRRGLFGWNSGGSKTKEEEEGTAALSSSGGAADEPVVNDSMDPSAVDQALEKLFQDDSNDDSMTSTTTTSNDGEWFTTATNSTSNNLDGSSLSAAAELTTAVASASSSSSSWEPTWYSLSDQAIVAVQTFHELTGVEYGWAIVGVTVGLRLALFPLMVKSQQTTSRMAHLQPELTLIKSRYEAIGTPSRQDQLAFSKQMKALFERYQVKPFRALLAPVVQLPLFMGMFFGLRKMPTIYHDQLATGGMFWFPDLTIPDPLYILPMASAGTFLLLIEMGKDQMMAQNAATGKLMVNVFRIMSLVMIPVCVNFESAMLCYWTANNALTVAQTAVLKAPVVKKQLGIWDPPKPVPGFEPESLSEAASKLMKRMQGQATSDKQEMERHNQEVEVKKKGRAMFQATARSRRQQHGNGGGITGKRSVSTLATTSTAATR